MKQFFKRLTQFSLLALVVIAGLFVAGLSSPFVETHLIAKRTDEGAVRLKTEEFEARYKTPSDTLDFLFLGSSTCYCGIDPLTLEVKGYSSFSLCSSAQTLFNSTQVLDYATQHCTPKYVVIDVYPELWSGPSSSLECERDWIINGPSLPLERIDPYNAFLKLYFSISKSLGIHHIPAKEEEYDKYSGLGFVERSLPAIKTVSCDSVRTLEFPPQLSAIVDSLQFETILIIPPLCCPDEYVFPESYTVIDGGQWPGASYKSSYYDDHHLNASGAVTYSGWLSEELIRITTDPSE